MSDLQTWRKMTPTLASALLHSLKSGHHSDIEFLVGPEKFRIFAHKTVLMLRSELFEIMFSEQWTQGTGGIVELEDINPEAFESFMKFMYTDILDENLSLNVLLEVMSLGTMYQIQLLVKQVGSVILSNHITPENCVMIYEYTKLLDKDFALEALEVIKKNIIGLLATANQHRPWDWETWHELLSTDNYQIKEVDLFKALVRWSNSQSDPRQKEKFTSLVQLIRFPLLGCEAFKEQVVLPDLLPKEDVIDMFLFFTDRTHINQNIKYLFKSRSFTHVSNSVQFSKALQNASEGDIIQLEEGEYSEPFTLSKNYLTIRGRLGTKFTATNGVEITSNSCNLSGIAFESGTKPIIISGSGNLVQNLLFTSVKQALQIDGDLNIFKNLEFTNLHGQSPGIQVTGDNNTIDGMEASGADTVCVLQISGNQNKFRDINYTSTPCSEIDNRIGVLLECGVGHEINGLTSKDEYNADTLLQIENGTEGAKVNKVISGMEVLIDGKGHELVNIFAKNKIQVDGTGHKFEGCKTEEWEVLGRVKQHEFVRCVGLHLG